MLLVKTYLNNSDQHGIGLFAAEDIKKGQVIWELNEVTSRIFWKKQFLSICTGLSHPSLLEIINHSYLKDGNVYFLNDNAKFINHSMSPNIALKDIKTEVAIKDICAGEELTENYMLSYDSNDFFFLDIDKHLSKRQILTILKNNFGNSLNNLNFKVS